jgi:hypothetical protein
LAISRAPPSESARCWWLIYFWTRRPGA